MANKTPYEWNPDDVKQFLKSRIDDSTIIDKIRNQEVNGKGFLQLNKEMLVNEQYPFKIKYGPAVKIMELVEDLNNKLIADLTKQMESSQLKEEPSDEREPEKKVEDKTKVLSNDFFRGIGGYVRQICSIGIVKEGDELLINKKYSGVLAKYRCKITKIDEGKILVASIDDDEGKSERFQDMFELEKWMLKKAGLDEKHYPSDSRHSAENIKVVRCLGSIAKLRNEYNQRLIN